MDSILERREPIGLGKQGDSPVDLARLTVSKVRLEGRGIGCLSEAPRATRRQLLSRCPHELSDFLVAHRVDLCDGQRGQSLCQSRLMYSG